MMHGRTIRHFSDCLGRAHGPAVHLLYVVALFLLLAVDSWGECTEGDFSLSRRYTGGDCPDASTVCDDPKYDAPYSYVGLKEASIRGTYCNNSANPTYSACSNSYPCNVACVYERRCNSPCDAQKAYCQLQGGIWVDSLGYGECDGYCKKDTCEGAECCEPGQIYWPPTDECLDSCATKTCCDMVVR